MSDDTKIEHPAVHTSAHADLLRQLDDAVRQTQGLPRLPILLREARAAIAQMAEERETLRETAHYANGTAELAMKHRDMAEAQLSEAQAQIGILDHVVAAIGRVLCDEPVSDFDQSYAEVRGVADLKAKLREARAVIAQMAQEREALRETAHYANGTAELAMKHRDLAEAQLREAQAQVALETESARAPLVEKVSSRNNSHIEDTVAQLLIDLAFLLPRGTNIRTTIGPRLVAFKEALEARQREAARAPLLALVAKWKATTINDGSERWIAAHRKCAAELEAALRR